jgi:mannose-6-phosphate isomerase
MYEILHEEPGLKVKKITVRAGNRLSLQKHSRREEFWTIIHGKGLITLGDNTLAVLPGLQIHILVEQLHRIEATTEDIVFIESQKGDYLEEDDIVRIEDDYAR